MVELQMLKKEVMVVSVLCKIKKIAGFNHVSPAHLLCFQESSTCTKRKRYFNIFSNIVILCNCAWVFIGL